MQTVPMNQIRVLLLQGLAVDFSPFSGQQRTVGVISSFTIVQTGQMRVIVLAKGNKGTTTR